MKSKKILKHYQVLLNHLHYYNNLAPFPIYSTEYVSDVEDKIKQMKEDKENDYDNEPVVACRYCKSLHIISDDVENTICHRCGSVNELVTFDNIHEYLKLINKDK